jgi:hypothetical protein
LAGKTLQHGVIFDAWLEDFPSPFLKNLKKESPMIIFLSTLAFAATTAGDGTAPVKTAAQLLEERVVVCEDELKATREDLADCGKHLETRATTARVRIPAKKPVAPPAPPAGDDADPVPPAPDAELPELPSVEDMQFDLSNTNIVVVSQPLPPPTAYNGIVPSDAPATFTEAPPMTPPSASAGGARYSVLLGATGGLGFAGVEPIVDASGTAVGGGLEVPLNAQLGVLFRENNGLALGLLAHATVEPLNFGTGGGVDIMVLGGKRLSKIGFALGGNYTAFQSLDGAANSWLWGGEAALVGLVPLINAHHRVSLNLLLEAGAKGGVLYNEDDADTTWLVDPFVSVGPVFAFGSRKF